MYMFELNWRTVLQPIVALIERQFISKMYILVSHSNGQSIRNTIGMVVNRLVDICAFSLFPLCPLQTFHNTDLAFSPYEI